MKHLLLCLLLATALSHAVILNSSPSTTKIASLAPRKLVALAPYHEANSCNHLGNGAKWIWNALTDRAFDGYTEIFETLFTPQCTHGSATLQITADNEFVAYLNGAKVGEGKDWREKFTFALTLQAGTNTLRVVVVNRDTDSPAGLIFAVTQTENGQVRTLAISGDGKTYIVTPPVLVEPYHTANQPNFLGNGAQWVWESRIEAANEGFISLFEKTFESSCAGGLGELLITADNEFTAYLNGQLVGSGKDWRKKFQFHLTLKAGTNTLRLIVINRGQGTPGGLIFSVTQTEAGASRILALSDPTLSIANGLVSFEPYHNYNQPNYLGNGANWIWDTRVGTLDEGYSVIFQNVFQAAASPATLTITADNEFAVYLNGEQVGTGNDWVRKYCFTVSPQAGSNVLEVVVVNRGQGTPGGLIFTVLQGGQVLALSDPATTSISPKVGVEDYHSANQADFLGTGAQWIWNDLGDDWPEGYSETFRSNFRADYTSPAAQLLITADNEFAAFLNGVFVGSGNNWRQKYQFEVSLLCGQNELIVVVLNRDKGSPAALIFSLLQDQSSPACKCDAAASCSALEVFNQQTCSCQCARARCPPGQVQDQSTCRCNLCRPVACKLGTKWDQAQCACVPICVETLFCIATKVFDPVRCACVCPSVQPCRPPSYWDESVCSCTFVLDPPALPVLPLPPVRPLPPVCVLPPQPQPQPFFPVKPLPQPLPAVTLPYDQPVSQPVQPPAPC